MTSSEADRQNALEKYNILDTTPETAFDDINRLAACICGTPIALIGLIDNNRQWFKSKVGWEALEIPRNIALCAHTIQQTELFAIQDTLADERFATNPLVISDSQIRFYAGVPLISSEGHALGTLCVMDRVPRKLSLEQQETLRVLSQQVVAQLELRRNSVERECVQKALQKIYDELEIRVEERTTELRNTNKQLQSEIVERQRLEAQLRRREQELSDFFENGAIGLHWVGEDGTILWANKAELELLGYSSNEYIGHHIANFHADPEVIDDILHRLTAKETLNDYEARLVCKDGSLRYVLIDSNVFWEDGRFIHTRCFTRDITERKRAEESLRARARQQASVAKLGQLALTDADPLTLMNEAVILVAQSLEVEYSKVLELLPDGSALLLRAGVGWQEELLGHRIVGAGTDSQADYTLLSNEPVIVEDLRTETRFSDPSLLHDHRVVSGLSVIIQNQNQPFGVFGAHTSRRRQFTQDDIHFLQAVANVIATAIERRRAQELLLERSRLAALDAAVGISLTQSNTLREILQQCTEALVQHLDAALARIWTLSSEKDVLELQASAGMYTHINGRYSRISVGQFQGGLIARERQPYLTNNVIGDPHFYDQKWVAREEMVSFAGYPLIIEERLVGVMAIFARQPLSEGALQAMESVANAISVGIQHKQAEQALRKSEERLQAILDNSPTVVYLKDTQGKYILVNRHYENLIHVTREHIAGKTDYDIFPQEMADIYRANDQKVLECSTALTFEEVAPVNGELRTYIEIKFPLYGSGEVPYAVCGIATDITERKQAEQALQKARDELEIKVQERTAELTKANQKLQTEIADRQLAEEALKRRKQEFKALVEHAPDIILRFNRELRYVYVNPAVERAMGIPPQTFIGKTNAELEMPADFCQLWEQKLQQVFATKQENIFEFSFSISSETKYYQSRLVPELTNDGSVEFVLSIARNITALKQAEAQLIHDAFHDALTGLPNRALFMDRLERALEYTKRRADYSFAVLFLDLDRFKLVNDSLGHTTGDQLLITLARRLETCLRSGDTVARLGGDEFTILLDDIKDASDVMHVANRIYKELTLPFNLSGYEVFTTASIGIAMSATDYKLPEELLRDADIAMYRAKALGKARYQVFGKDMHIFAVAQLQLEMDLRRAIACGEFRLHYQPIVSLETGKIYGFEALVRWQHPNRGLIYPAEFIPLAEETGLIVPIGQWVLREACHQMNSWQEQSSTNLLTVSVNLSRKQFVQPDLIKQIKQILHETNLNAHNLSLEITESVIMENFDAATSMLLQLKALGVQQHMDDFGTGYSSLSYLHRFPMHTLKIDRSFVSRMGINSGNSEIVKTIVTLAHSLNMKVTAEGVETAEQLVQLRKLKCEYAQGYFFSKPVNSDMAKVLITKNPRW